ncbi:MAG: alpha/beta hydrolase [Lautropia sp.]
MEPATLNPQAAALIALIDASGRPPMHRLSVADARADYLARRHIVQPDAPPVASVVERFLDVDGCRVPVRHYRPAGSADRQPLPALVYLHGGGWTIGDRDSHDVLCRLLANGSGCAVFNVDYRMGPEHRFPAAVDDAVAAVRWVAAGADALGVDPNRLAIGGDSAGGNLSAVAAITLRDAGGPRVALQLLIYPATDLRMGHDSHTRNGEGYLLTAELMRWFRAHYLADPGQALDWRASPLLAARLDDLPPAFLLTAGFDPLVDEGLAYARRLEQAGVPVESAHFESQIHGFITMGRVLDDANRAVERCCEALRTAFRPRPPGRDDRPA